MAKPTAPTGDFKLKNITYGEDGLYTVMTDSEFKLGKNNVGEVETPLGSTPDAQKENYLFQYLTAQILYLSQMVDYLVSKVDGGA